MPFAIPAGLKKSKFRSRFKLDEKDLEYLSTRGADTIRLHAQDFISKRLAPRDLPNDGKQTPTKGHPVFKAQHATATCCRGCLQKWYKIPKDRSLTSAEIENVVGVIMIWIHSQNLSKIQKG